MHAAPAQNAETVDYTDEVRDAALDQLRELFGGQPPAEDLITRARAFAADPSTAAAFHTQADAAEQPE
ncbi:hypothetical protein [Streptosporangium sp. NPDC051022]|uniref:hypothetical protein n=1 Tax=Streptosporangium sp. NPDC051022 TaxID=3155752 RepID=UPI003430B5D1